MAGWRSGSGSEPTDCDERIDYVIRMTAGGPKSSLAPCTSAADRHSAEIAEYPTCRKNTHVTHSKHIAQPNTHAQHSVQPCSIRRTVSITYSTTRHTHTAQPSSDSCRARLLSAGSPGYCRAGTLGDVQGQSMRSDPSGYRIVTLVSSPRPLHPLSSVPLQPASE